MTGRTGSDRDFALFSGMAFEGRHSQVVVGVRIILKVILCRLYRFLVISQLRAACVTLPSLSCVAFSEMELTGF